MIWATVDQINNNFTDMLGCSVLPFLFSSRALLCVKWLSFHHSASLIRGRWASTRSTWRRLLRVPWTARRSNQSILKEISPGCSMEGLMLKVKLQYFGHLCKDLTHWKRLWCWERLNLFFLSISPFSSVQFISVTQLFLTPCDPMDHSMPGLPVHHQLQEFTQTHIHWVGDALQPSHPMPSPSPPALNLSQHQSLFQWVISLHRWPKYNFTLYNRFQVHPSHQNWLTCVPFYGWVIFHCVYVPFLYLFICWWTSWLFLCSSYCK